MNINKQHGKGLSGFMLGLLLATLVIAAILFFLNRSSKDSFKQQEPVVITPPVPEILTPKESASMPDLSASSASDLAASGVDVLEGFILEQNASEPQTAPVTPAVPVAPKAEKPAAKPTQQPNAEAKPKPEPKPAPAAKPTPEQILDSGSIEKARKEAQKEAVQKAERKPAPAAGGNLILQMGSFGDQQSADAQRAKLAMMGVSSNVVQATVNGKTVYRVQSGRLSRAEAERTRQTLKQNGVDSLTRNAN